MTARPLRLRWTLPSANGVWSLILTLGLEDINAGHFMGYVKRETLRPATYRAVTAAGQVLRGNNRRRLQRRLMAAVRAELARVARRAA